MKSFEQARAKELGLAVKESRQRRPMTQESLAIAAGLSRKTIGRIERGDSASPETQLAVLSVLQDIDLKEVDRKGKLN